jgi:hypothetical protein
MKSAWFWWIGWSRLGSAAADGFRWCAAKRQTATNCVVGKDGQLLRRCEMATEGIRIDSNEFGQRVKM